MSHVDSGAVSVGVVLTIALGAGVWKSGTLRSEIVERYQSRLDEALGKLEDRSRVLLGTLAVEYSASIGGLDAATPATNVRINAADFQPLIEQLAALLKALARLPKYFSTLLKVGPTLAVLLSLAIVSELVAFSYLSGWSHARTSCEVSLFSFALFIVLSAVVTIVNFLTLQFFTNAELLASESRQT
jgi:hypothetical protein